MQLELGENHIIWYCLFFFLHAKCLKRKEGKVILYQKNGHCFDMGKNYSNGGGGVGNKTDNYPKGSGK